MILLIILIYCHDFILACISWQLWEFLIFCIIILERNSIFFKRFFFLLRINCCHCGFKEFAIVKLSILKFLVPCHFQFEHICGNQFRVLHRRYLIIFCLCIPGQFQLNWIRLHFYGIFSRWQRRCGNYLIAFHDIIQRIRVTFLKCLLICQTAVFCQFQEICFRQFIVFIDVNALVFQHQFDWLLCNCKSFLFRGIALKFITIFFYHCLNIIIASILWRFCQSLFLLVIVL